MATEAAAPPGELTPRQREIYTWIYERTRADGYQPRYSEIMGYFALAGPNGVAGTLKALQRKGYLRIVPRRTRGLEFLLRPDGRPFRGFADREG